ncbi:MAG: hypothetical protein ACSHXK_10230 [Oceanococcus sp.]
MEKLLLRFIQFGIVIAVLAWWWQDRFVPIPLIQHGEPLLEPVQKATKTNPIQAQIDGVEYQVIPYYDYEIYGLVVSLRFHNGDTGLHKLWNDHLNVADFCIVWGSNASELDLNAFHFENLQFTCNYRTKDSQQWAKFRGDQLSNNHLISDDPRLRDMLMQTQIGDVIRIRGQLSHYGEFGQAPERMRGTSTVRTDSGNGACETIWVQEFERLAVMPNPWRPTGRAALWLLAFCIPAWGWGVGSGRFKQHR